MPPAEPRGHDTSRAAAAPALAALLCVLGSCGVRDFDNENDRLRRLTLEQERQIKALQSERSELESKLAEANLARESALDPAVFAALPRCAGILVESLSGLRVPAEGETRGPSITAYIDPFDGRQRFVQIVGTLTVDAIIAGPTGSAAPRTVSATLALEQLREAYRDSVTGAFYLIEMPLDPGEIPAEGTVTIRATFVDALSGLTHTAESTSRIVSAR